MALGLFGEALLLNNIVSASTYNFGLKEFVKA